MRPLPSLPSSASRTFPAAALAVACILAIAGLGCNGGGMEEAGANMQGWFGIDLIKMMHEMDLVGKLCLVLLAAFSVASWGVIILKFLQIRQADKQTQSFVKACSAGNGRLEEAFKISADYPNSPLAQILREGYLELELENWYREGYNLDDAGRVEMAKVGIERVFDRTITNEISQLEAKLIFLATTTSVSPFVGLFGTVWGIMLAFQGFNDNQQMTIAMLAPGLSTALLVTVGGLFCAIPASLFYNYLTNLVRHLTFKMDAFALELSNIIQKQIVKQGPSQQ